MEDEDKCKHTQAGTCLYYEDSDLKCEGNQTEQDHCAEYSGYQQL